MINKEPIDIEEFISIIIRSGESKEIKELISNLEELYNKYCHNNFNKLTVSLLVRDGKSFLNLVGVRKENEKETKKRIIIEEDKLKRLEEIELKEYLRLKRKYGKENNE